MRCLPGFLISLLVLGLLIASGCTPAATPTPRAWEPDLPDQDVEPSDDDDDPGDDWPDLPDPVYEHLEGAAPAFFNDFDAFEVDNFEFNNLDHRDGMLELSSHGEWEGYLFNLYENESRAAYMLRFLLTDDVQFLFSLRVGERWEADFSEWAIGYDGQAYYWVEDIQEFVPMEGDLGFELNTWYDALLAVKEDGAVFAGIWETYDPEVAAFAAYDLGEPFMREGWRMEVTVEDSILQMDAYYAVYFDTFEANPLLDSGWAADDWTGEWTMWWPTGEYVLMTLWQDGDVVTGRIFRSDNETWTVEGEISEGVLTAEFLTPDGGANQLQGILAGDGEFFVGNYGYGNQVEWCGARGNLDKPDPCYWVADDGEWTLDYFDDFEAPNSGWEIVDIEGARAGYEDSAYVVSLWDNSGYVFSSSRTYADAHIEVDITFQNGSPEHWALGGIQCRGMYKVLLGNDGSYTIGYETDTDFVDLGNAYFHEAIRVGNQTNHLAVTCEGSTITVYVNDQFVDEVEGMTVFEGELLFEAGVLDSYEIAFDNLEVYAP